MNADTLRKAAIVASTYNNSDIWEKEYFRFKNHDDFGKSELFTLRNSDLIKDRGDDFSTTTWEFTDEAQTVIKMVETSPITEASDDQLAALKEHAERVLDLPRTDTFLASEYGMIGQNIQTLSSCGLIEQVDTQGQLGIWELDTLAVRILTSLEAVEMRQGNLNKSKIIA